jgi:hypothetical protein
VQGGFIALDLRLLSSASVPDPQDCQSIATDLIEDFIGPLIQLSYPGSLLIGRAHARRLNQIFALIQKTLSKSARDNKITILRRDKKSNCV